METCAVGLHTISSLPWEWDLRRSLLRHRCSSRGRLRARPIVPGSLIVSFSAPSSALHIESPDFMSVTLSLRSTPRMSKMFISKLGMSLEIFAASLMDRSQVFVVPDEPQRLDESLDEIFSTDNHQENSVCVATYPQDCHATTLTARTNITDVPTRDVLSSGAKVSCHQVSPCVMQVRVGQTRRSLAYPLPVIGSRSKLRVARNLLMWRYCSYPRIPDSSSQSTI